MLLMVKMTHNWQAASGLGGLKGEHCWWGATASGVPRLLLTGHVFPESLEAVPVELSQKILASLWDVGLLSHHVNMTM